MSDASREHSTTPPRQVIAPGDVAALDALPLDAVLVCRVHEVFQAKSAGPIARSAGHDWYALGYGDRVWTSAEVAEWGPLEVVWTPSLEPAPDRGLDPTMIPFRAAICAHPSGSYSQLAEYRGLFVRLDTTGYPGQPPVVVLAMPDTDVGVRLLASEYTFHFSEGHRHA